MFAGTAIYHYQPDQPGYDDQPGHDDYVGLYFILQNCPYRPEISLMSKPGNPLNAGSKTPVPGFIVNARRIIPGIAEVEVELSGIVAEPRKCRVVLKRGLKRFSVTSMKVQRATGVVLAVTGDGVYQEYVVN